MLGKPPILIFFQLVLINSIKQEYIIEPRSDNRDLLAIKVKSEIFTETERPSCCEQL